MPAPTHVTASLLGTSSVLVQAAKRDLDPSDQARLPPSALSQLPKGEVPEALGMSPRDVKGGRYET
jgi:hypothetical protein